MTTCMPRSLFTWNWYELIVYLWHMRRIIPDVSEHVRWQLWFICPERTRCTSQNKLIDFGHITFDQSERSSDKGRMNCCTIEVTRAARVTPFACHFVGFWIKYHNGRKMSTGKWKKRKKNRSCLTNHCASSTIWIHSKNPWDNGSDRS